MTIGDFLRNSDDEQMAGILLTWLLTILALVGVDYKLLDLEVEYDEVLKYLHQPMTSALTDAVSIWGIPSDLKS